MKTVVLALVCLELSFAFYVPITYNGTAPGKSNVIIIHDLLMEEVSLEDMSLTEHFLTTNPPWLFEGDIIPQNMSRKVTNRRNFWPNGLINYRLDSSFSSAHLTAIADSIAHWEENTCLRFFDKTSNSNFDQSSDHIYFQDDQSGCFSYVGRIGGQQPVNIGSGCQFPKVVIHEIGHAIGFHHEQSRSGRDDFVRILFDNIQPGLENNFRESNTDNYGIEYDYLSIMHYPPRSFERVRYAMNTIQSVDPVYQYVMGRGQVLSFRDQKAANVVYCSEKNALDCAPGDNQDCGVGFLGPSCRCVCPNGVSGSSCQTGQEVQTELPCGETITSPGTYSTPLYPRRANNWKGASCVFKIQAANGQRVRVYFEDFSFNPKASFSGSAVCIYDQVEVRVDGANSEVPFICGEELKESTVVSTGDEMVILINSMTRRNVGKGMKFDVEFFGGSGTTNTNTMTTPSTTVTMTTPSTTVTMTTPSSTVTGSTATTLSTTASTIASTTIPITTGSSTTSGPNPQITCGDVSASISLTTGESIDIKSINFNVGNYPNNHLCTVDIQNLNSGDRLKFDLIFMDIEIENRCKNDALKLLSLSGSRTYLTACGQSGSFAYTFPFSAMRVEFKTNDAVTAKGFHIRLTAVGN